MKKRPAPRVFPSSVPKIKGNFNIVTFDIECSDLNADKSVMMSAVVKPLKGKPVVFINKNLGTDKGLDDKEICIALRDELEKANIVISYYGLGFDIPYLNTRLLFWGERTLRKHLHIDCYRLVKKNFRVTRRSLANITAHFQIKGKNHIPMIGWKKAEILGDEKSLAYVVDHNIKDCIILEELFYRLCPLIQAISLA